MSTAFDNQNSQHATSASPHHPRSPSSPTTPRTSPPSTSPLSTSPISNTMNETPRRPSIGHGHIALNTTSIASSPSSPSGPPSAGKDKRELPSWLWHTTTTTSYTSDKAGTRRRDVRERRLFGVVLSTRAEEESLESLDPAQGEAEEGEGHPVSEGEAREDEREGEKERR